MSSPHFALINGANRGLGLGFVKRLLQEPDNTVIAVCRNVAESTELCQLEEQNPSRLLSYSADSTEESALENLSQKLRERIPRLHLLLNCVGYLHNAQHGPEKSLRQINAEQLMESIRVNTLPTVLLAKHFQRYFKHEEPSTLAAISARVGSIEDNRMGGWYSYRSSKAALNMMIRNIAIEYHRSCPNTKVLALHPGTVDTRLSEPFSKNVAPEKLFSVDYSVQQLLEVLQSSARSPQGAFYAWDGERLPW